MPHGLTGVEWCRLSKLLLNTCVVTVASVLQTLPMTLIGNVVRRAL